jgi:hypothetical protein
MRSRGFLCSRCGSPRQEIVGKGEQRCSDCGLGVTFSSVSATFAPAVLSARATPTHEQPKDTDRWLRATLQQDLDELASAAFSAYGLDHRWNGLRWLGGRGGSDGVVSYIQLAHGNTIGDPAATQIRVGTRASGNGASRDLGWYETAQHHIAEIWRRTGTLSEDVRRAAFPMEPTKEDPTAPWGETLLPIDEEPVTFRILAEAGFWVAQARHAETIVSIEAVAWPIEQTGIVTIQDLTEYEAGSQEIRTRWK